MYYIVRTNNRSPEILFGVIGMERKRNRSRRIGQRLGRPGRAILRILALTAVLMIFWMVGSPLAESRPSQFEAMPIVTVEKGDTLWALAAQVAKPDEDIRDVVGRLMEINRLTSPSLRPGQILYLPPTGR